jgi:hypothetical protein
MRHTVSPSSRDELELDVSGVAEAANLTPGISMKLSRVVLAVASIVVLPATSNPVIR